MKSVLITGGNRGLGFELVKIFHENGYKVFTVVRREEDADKLKAQFINYIYPIISDMRYDSATQNIKKITAANSESIDVVINNAGIIGHEYKIEKVSTEDFLEVVNVHCASIIRTTQAVLPLLLKSTNPRIVNISSRFGSLTNTANLEYEKRKISYSYRVAKAAQNMLSLCLNQELNEKGISINCVHPGKLLTASGASDADTIPKDAAIRIFDWVETLDSKKTANFVEPFIQDFPW